MHRSYSGVNLINDTYITEFRGESRNILEEQYDSKIPKDNIFDM